MTTLKGEYVSKSDGLLNVGDSFAEKFRIHDSSFKSCENEIVGVENWRHILDIKAFSEHRSSTAKLVISEVRNDLDKSLSQI